MPLICDAENCENVAAWAIPHGKYTEHLCHKHHHEAQCSDPDCNDPECRVHGRDIRMYGGKK